MDVQLIHFDMVEIFPISAGDRQKVTVTCGAAPGVQLLAQRFDEEGEILLVLGSLFDAGDPLSGILPVKINAIELILSDEVNDTACKQLPGRVGQRGVRKSLGLPAADRDEDLEIRVLFSQGLQAFQAIRDPGVRESDVPGRIDAGKREVEVGELLSMDDSRNRPARHIRHNPGLATGSSTLSGLRRAPGHHEEAR
jgi:hypothetical protein